MHEAELTYTKGLVQRGVRCYCMRSFDVRYWGLLLLVVAASAAYFFLALHVEAWILTIMGVSVALGLVFPILVYAVHYRTSIRRFRQMSEPTVHFIAEADTFTFSSSSFTAELSVGVVTAIWKCSSDLWVIASERGFNVLPIESVSQTMRAFIEECVRNAGGQVQ